MTNNKIYRKSKYKYTKTTKIQPHKKHTNKQPPKNKKQHTHTQQINNTQRQMTTPPNTHNINKKQYVKTTNKTRTQTKQTRTNILITKKQTKN